MSHSTLKILFLCFMLISFVAACQPEAKPGNCPPFETENVQINNDTAKLLDEMNNDEVIWLADFAGLRPGQLTGATLLLLDTQEDIAPFLFDALLDEDRFVAANVLLAWRSDILALPIRDEWNGLKVQFKGNDAVYEGNDLTMLQQYWCQKAIELVAEK